MESGKVRFPKVKNSFEKQLKVQHAELQEGQLEGEQQEEQQLLLRLPLQKEQPQPLNQPLK